jgi:hypothetical protein
MVVWGLKEFQENGIKCNNFGILTCCGSFNEKYSSKKCKIEL